MKHLHFIFLSLISVVLTQCDIKDSDIKNDQSFIRIFHDSDFSNDYHPLDVVELNDGYLILSTKIQDSIAYSYLYHIPYIVKTDIEGNVEWTVEGAYPYVSPIPDILEIKNRYYYFALNIPGLSPTLFEINLVSKDIDLISGGIFEDNVYALKSIVDSDGDILLLTNNNLGETYTKLHKITGVPDNPKDEIIVSLKNSANNGTERLKPIIFEHLGHNGKRYPFSIQNYKLNNNIDSYLVNCFENDVLSLCYVNANDYTYVNWIIGSLSGRGNLASKAYVNSYCQLNDSILGLVKNDNNKISILPNLLLNKQNYNYQIDVLNEGTNFIELDGNSLMPSRIISYNEVKYLVFAISTKGEQVALFIYNTDDYTLHNIYYLGSTNDIEPVTIKQTKDDGLLVLCKTLVTNKYPRIALFKIPLKEIGI